MASLNMPSSAPARKVVGATAGAGVGGVTANLIVWGLDDFAFDPDAANSVPDAVSAFIFVVVPLVLSFVGGYFTRRDADELIAPAPQR